MADVRKLEQTLEETLTWNKARINFLAKFIVALIQVRTVNFTEIANVFSGGAKEESKYKRIQRFMRHFEISYSAIAVMIIKMMKLSGPWVLTMDRTNWQIGAVDINILMLAIVYKGVAIPLFWKLLDKKGNSNTAERIAIMGEYLKVFELETISYLCADREFIGKKWIAYLRHKKIDFRIRIRENTLVTNARGERRNAWMLFAFTRTEEVLLLDKPRIIWGMPLYFAGVRLFTGEYLIVISADFTDTIVDDYGKRWEIESLFTCLKTRGFRLEETHLTDRERLKKLIALLAIAFGCGSSCWRVFSST